MKIHLPKFSKRRLILSSITLIFIIVLVLFIRRLQGPSIGYISSAPDIQKTEVKMANYDAKYATFDYQQDLEQEESGKKQPNVLENYIFTKGVTGAHSAAAYLAITVYSIASGKIEDNSAYSYRKNHPEMYSSRVLEVNNTNVILMTKNDAKEVVAFLPYKNKLGSIALTSPLATGSEFQSRFDGLLNSWHWK